MTLKLQAQGFSAQGTVDFAVVRQILDSNASSQLTALQKGSLRAVACGAVWPKDRLAAGYDVDPTRRARARSSGFSEAHR